MASKVTPAPLARPLHEIAREIRRDHDAQGRTPYFGAVPYLDALARVSHLSDPFYDDTADDIVIYLLSNLKTWRGETATRVKAELRAALADHARAAR